MLQIKKHIEYVILITIFFSTNVMAQKLYFSTPQESVELTSKLLIDENWESLFQYYYLDNTDEKIIDSLKNGSYFIRTKKPEVAHPGGFWKYKKPFSPSFSYLSHIQISEDTIKVEVMIEIDQGNGMIQQGRQFFYLIKLDKGFQLLP